MGGTPLGWAGLETRRVLLSYRRARTVLGLCAVFWLWLVAGGPGWWPGMYQKLVPTLLGLYALAVLTMASLFAALVSCGLIHRYRTHRAAPSDPAETSPWANAVLEQVHSLRNIVARRLSGRFPVGDVLDKAPVPEEEHHSQADGDGDERRRRIA
jgi:hypothetical protein